MPCVYKLTRTLALENVVLHEDANGNWKDVIKRNLNSFGTARTHCFPLAKQAQEKYSIISSFIVNTNNSSIRSIELPDFSTCT